MDVSFGRNILHIAHNSSTILSLRVEKAKFVTICVLEGDAHDCQHLSIVVQFDATNGLVTG